jgi:hypothetical protein
MNILIIFIAIILVLIIFSSGNTEKMTNIKNDSDKKCCLVEKKYLPDDKSLQGGNFKYVYNSKGKSECDPLLYDTNKQLLINEKCSDKSNLGSCRMINNECVEFVTKEFCDKVPGMVWSEKTCNNPLEYVWQDRIVRNIPEKDKNDGSYNMFPEKFKKF